MQLQYMNKLKRMSYFYRKQEDERDGTHTKIVNL